MTASVTLVVAMDEQGLIGCRGDLPWRLPADLARFKRLTMGHPILMGRRTWESIGRPLPGRTNMVLTRRTDFAPEGVVVVGALEEALDRAGGFPGGEELMVIGGAEVYRLFLPRATRLQLTRVDGRFEGDVFFPHWNPADFELLAEERRDADEKNPHAMTFQTWERLRRPPAGIHSPRS
ncbi:MAG TPA: dihydrofolate reductase [Planctomycetes bacterium]|nr:dihydrofolate reductase [Planctomycetota bacterium]